MSLCRLLSHQAFDQLIARLNALGYRCIGPRVQDGHLVYSPLARFDELPRGVRQTQVPGAVRLHATDGPRAFAWANDDQCLKPFLFAPEEPLWAFEKDADGIWRSRDIRPAPEPMAIFGVRACDLAALALQDRHFRSDPWYQARRQQLFLVAVHCTHPASTCFCASTGDGPQAQRGYDLALYETDAGFLLETGSPRGEAAVAPLELPKAAPERIDEAQQEVAEAARHQQRQLPPADALRQLQDKASHPAWADIASHCLSCGNCTSVCPSCFCYDETDSGSLDGRNATRARQWGSCFAPEHGRMAGLDVRTTVAQRYRQWLTHKLASWQDQYDRPGCTGCGRCISWCPAGIDLVAAVAALASPHE
jgi:sulfhydrogenase subunit beta (sulfur reductase)